ncbi:hypothetical protein Y11_32011 [Yersinia enterocolitica subsp. palearctica Y11]|uniref:Uncharacterized protein n=1 Tax=Yersinia enterocolitica subsp. palearctica serotype O:3 (strain DSM 13030 / CIP 106945 / Y11) TaxID=930944 RepID=A0A0H3P105_YERE1|nr:hypothetical protein Y11_32011 [Yersinia enterocolitica subsp. palearctica Y11]
MAVSGSGHKAKQYCYKVSHSKGSRAAIGGSGGGSSHKYRALDDIAVAGIANIG